MQTGHGKEHEEPGCDRERSSHCPKCGVSLDGGSIWEYFYDLTGSEEEADRSASMYGATREKGRWGRAIGIYNFEQDRTVAFRCPDCNHEWERI
jgi:hypothetical protein